MKALRPVAVRRWCRRPLLWAITFAILTVWFGVGDVVAAYRFDQRYDGGLHVTAEIAEDWDGGNFVPLSYRNPDSGEIIQTVTEIHTLDPKPTGPGPVEVDVSPANPRDVVITGDHRSLTDSAPIFGSALAISLLVWASRRWTLKRTDPLVTSETPAFAMRARAAPPRLAGLRWRLHLFPLDGGSDVRSVCTLPLVARPAASGEFTVEVKGDPKPFGRAIAKDSDGTVLWPSGRALATRGRTTAAIDRIPRRRTISLAIAAAVGVALIGIGIPIGATNLYADDLRERAQLTSATVTAVEPRDDTSEVTLTYTFDDQTYTRRVTLADPPEPGSAVSLLVDTEQPDRSWLVTQRTPPGSSEADWGGTFIVLGIVILIASSIGLLRANPRIWDRVMRRPPSPALPPPPGPAPAPVAPLVPAPLFGPGHDPFAPLPPSPSPGLQWPPQPSPTRSTGAPPDQAVQRALESLDHSRKIACLVILGAFALAALSAAATLTGIPLRLVGVPLGVGLLFTALYAVVLRRISVGRTRIKAGRPQPARLEGWERLGDGVYYAVYLHSEGSTEPDAVIGLPIRRRVEPSTNGWVYGSLEPALLGGVALVGEEGLLGVGRVIYSGRAHDVYERRHRPVSRWVQRPPKDWMPPGP